MHSGLKVPDTSSLQPSANTWYPPLSGATSMCVTFAGAFASAAAGALVLLVQLKIVWPRGLASISWPQAPNDHVSGK